jgi:chromate transporter
MQANTFDSDIVKEGSPRHYPSFREAFLFWLKLGFISFGGPAGQIGIMHEFLVEKKKWISESRFMHALNYCMVLPGPEAQQLATYTGWLLHGVGGGITAGVLFILPGLLLLLALSLAYVTFGKLLVVSAFFVGLKPAVIAIIIVALIKIASKSLKTSLHVAIALISFGLIFFLNISFPFIVMGAILVAAVATKFFPSLILDSPSNKSVDSDEKSFIINNLNPSNTARPRAGSVAAKILVSIFLWVIPIFIVFLLQSDFSFWKSLILFFTKAAFVTFGGAYAVLPYVAQVSVEKFHWLTDLQMIDGLALGETTPGPLILILVFVGFMAGYNHYSGSLLAGTAGLFLTAYYTFLPSFLFILVGAPWVERSKDNFKLKHILSMITAAVVGVILNLTIYIGQSILLTGTLSLHIFSMTWVMISLLALYRFKLNMIMWIFISGAAGYLFQAIDKWFLA